MKTFLIINKPCDCKNIVEGTRFTLPAEVTDYIQNNGGIENVNSFRILFACTPINAENMPEPYFCISSGIPGLTATEYSVEDSGCIEIVDKEQQLAMQDNEYGLPGKIFNVVNGRVYATLIVDKDNLVNNTEVIFHNMTYYNPDNTLRSIGDFPLPNDYISELPENEKEIETLYNEYVVVSA